MLFFLVSCLSFLLLSHIKSRVWKSPLIFREFFVLLNQKRKIFLKKFQIPTFFPPIKKISSPKFQFLHQIDEEKQSHEITLLDLPDLALDCILEKLSPLELCSMAGVCSWMREKCTSDHLWEKLMREKWGDVIGDAAYREWQSQLASKRHRKFLHSGRSGFGLLAGLFGFFGPELEKKRSVLPMNSVMSCYLALESGKFWFPAQVFNRENGHVGFMLSCYDAQLSYSSTTDNFIARYKSQGRSMIEEGIEWKRIRAPSVDTPPNVLHISDCLNQLKPNDHIEIQWRKNKAFPYGWWYGVVGHLHSCTANEFNCHCHTSDTIVLEFKQYAPGSRWRKTMISRKEHREVGNEADGFYGGIRKLSKKEEIEKWKQLWPNCTLE